MFMTDSAKVLFHLLRLATGKEAAGKSPADSADFCADWQEVYRLAAEQGVLAIAFNGFKRLAVTRCDNLDSGKLVTSLGSVSDSGLLTSGMSEELYYSWLGQVMLQEQRYDAQKRAMLGLSEFYERHGIGMTVLKGYGLSLNYPEPEHRPVGDIDVWLFDKASADGVPAWKRGDAEVEKALGIKVDSSHEHHTVFVFEGCMVENHYDIINTKGTRSSRQIDHTLKELLLKEHELHESNIYLPSATFNAIFLIRHMGQHIAGEKVSLRHLLDWGLFLDKHFEEVDWEFVLPYWQKMGIGRFASAVNTICKRYLGFDERIFHGALMNEGNPLVERLMNDILSPEFKIEKPAGGTLQTSLWKTRRFFANGWKRRLVYKEGLLESFVFSSISKVIRNDYR